MYYNVTERHGAVQMEKQKAATESKAHRNAYCMSIGELTIDGK